MGTARGEQRSEEEEGKIMEEEKMNRPKKAKKGNKRNEVFIHGNYPFYYGYRIGRDAQEDPRISAFKKEWFEGKDCLDVGCNQGLVTIAIAKKFLCRSILGIDIDADLVKTAYCNLKKMSMNVSKKGEVSEVLDDQGSSNPPSSEGDICSIVSFKAENFVKTLGECSEEYDTILCLSLTKWIHLNSGDDGLITLFVKIWRLLRPGGILILEPQPLSSYKRYRTLSETTATNYKNSQLHPDRFREILLDKVGFRSAEDLSDTLTSTIAGFKRPIVVFRK